MGLNFVIPEINIGGTEGIPTLQFYRRGFNLLGTSGTPSWQDIILSGNTALTLVNSKAGGLNYLKLFGNTEQRNLPSEYTQLEYIESDGTQYIDLGDVLDTSTDDIEIEVQLLQTESLTNFFGARENTTSSVYTLASSGAYWRWGWKDNSTASDVTTDLNKHVLRIDHTNNTLSLDGIVVETKGNDVTNIVTPTTPTLFAIHATSTQTLYFSTIRISAFRKWRNGELVQSVVSCRRNSDNVLGMYDTVTGNFLTNAGTRTFTAGANAVPTPDAPMDIVSNNGVVKVSPNLVKFNETRIDSSTWDSADKTKGFEVRADVYGKSVGDSMLSNANTFGAFVPCKQGESISLDFFNYEPMYARCFYCEITADRKCNTTPQSYASSSEITQKTFTLTQSNSIGFVFEWYINSQQTRDYTASNYMIVKGSTPPTKYMPYGQIYTDGTQETVQVTGKNLFDIDSCIDNTYISSDGTTNFSATWKCSGFIPVLPNTGYVFTVDTTSDGAAKHCFYAQAKTESFISYINSGSQTFTTPSNARYMRISVRKESEQAQLELGSTATTYEPYFNGGSATAEMLLKVGSYQDVQSVLDGGVTHRCGVKVLDGTENWRAQDGSRTWGYCYSLDTTLQNAMAGINTNCSCTHFKPVARCWDTATEPCFSFHQSTLSTWIGKPFFVVEQDTAQKFKQWLADQYNAGTPVIIVYPLATATTETVTAQPLTIQAGTNIIQITEASISNLPLEVSYKGTV